MSTPTTVLLVDDEPSVLELTATFLERVDEGLSTVTAPNAATAAELLEERPVDCVVSDYEMPGTDGLEFLQRVRADHGDLPFILFTGKGSEEIASEAVSAGVTDYLQKSAGSDQYEVLANRITNAVDRAAAERRAADLARINELIRVVQQGLVRAGTREEIERLVCDSITDADPYRFAWVGVPDEDSGIVEPVATAGAATGYLDEITVRFDDTPEGRGPGGEAVRSREPQIVHQVGDSFDVRAWQRATDERGFEAVAVLPLLDGETLHGVLAVYADRPGAFDEEERAVLTELAATVATAVTSAETRRRLEQYETVIDAVDDPMYVCDETGTFLFVNDAFRELTGYDPDELVGRHATTVVEETTLARIERHIPELVSSSGRDSETFEIDVQRADGTVVPCEDHVGVLPFDETYRGTAGVVRDISDRRADERARRRLYEFATDPNRDVETTCRELLALGCDRLDVADGRLVAIDTDRERHETVYAVDREQEGIVSTLSRTYCRQAIETDGAFALHDLGETAWADDPAYERYDHECYTGAEVVVDGEMYGSVCFVDTAPRDGSFTESERSFVELVARTVGYELERRVARERIEHREQILRRLHHVVAAPDRSYEATLDRVLELGRDALGSSYAVLSHVRDDSYELEALATPEHHDQFEAGDVLDISRTACERTVAEEETVHVEAMHETPPWNEKPIHTETGMDCYIGTPVFVDGEFYGTLCYLDEHGRETPFAPWEETLVELMSQWVGYTLTERANEAALSRERDRLEEFAGAVSHDLRTPLSVAVGHLDLAREACACGEADESLSTVEDALDRMDGLIDDTLVLARQGETVGETEPVSPRRVAERVWDQLDTDGATVEFGDDLPTVDADPDRLRRLFENVLSNALDHGGPDVTVTVASAASDPPTVGFRIGDDGPGVPDGERTRVFERGYSTSPSGTGFGLSIVERIAAAHDWDVTMTESEAGGASVVFADVEPA